MANTTNQSYPKPVAANNLSADVVVLQTAFDKVDLDVKSLFTAMDTKSPSGHGHVVADVAGLQGALDAKAPTGHTHALDNLTDVDGAAGAAAGMLLQKTPTGFVPVSVAAAVGPSVTALVDAGLADKMDKSANLGDVVDASAARTNIGAASKKDVRRNRIVNPCVQISQENGDILGTTSGYYPSDEFEVLYNSSAGSFSSQRIQSATLAGAKDRMRLSVTTADVSLGAGEHFHIRQKIEGTKMADARWGTANAIDLVCRFMFNGPAGTYSIAIKNFDNTRSFVREFTTTGVDEVIEVTFPGDTSGTWPTDNSLWGTFNVTVAIGSTYQTTPNTWATGNYLGTASTSNGMGAIQSFDIGDIGLKLDPDSTGVYGEFEVPDYDQNKLACKRYYAEIPFAGVIHVIGNGNTNSTTLALFLIPMVEMRNTPSVSVTASNYRVRVNGASKVPSSFAVQGASSQGIYLTAAVSGASAYHACSLIAAATPMIFDARL